MTRLIFLSAAGLIAAGAVCVLASSLTGDEALIRAFFAGPGSVFLVACGALQLWLAARCWRRFSAGDLLRPAWLLITLSAGAQLAGVLLTHAMGARSHGDAARLTTVLHDLGQFCNPLYMGLLAAGLFAVLRTCRRQGMLGRLRALDWLLVSGVIAYTANFLSTVASAQGFDSRIILSWTSDPLLCVLLLEAILIRRSASTMGWGLISRCWLSFTAAIFLTSLGDFGLWAWSKGYLPPALVACSWFVWFLAAAAYALGPAYQLMAMLRAERGEIGEVVQPVVCS